MKKFLTIVMIVGIMAIGFGCAVQSNGANKQPDNLIFIGEITGNYIYEFKDSKGREFILAETSHGVSIVQIK